MLHPIFAWILIIGIVLLWNWLRQMRWSNECAHGSLNDMAWLEVVWHFHNMCGIGLGVWPDKKCGKKRFAWNQPLEMLHYHWQTFRSVFDSSWMLSNNLRRRSKHRCCLALVQRTASPVGRLGHVLGVLALGFALRISRCKIFMNLFVWFDNFPLRTLWRVFFL